MSQFPPPFFLFVLIRLWYTPGVVEFMSGRVTNIFFKRLGIKCGWYYGAETVLSKLLLFHCVETRGPSFGFSFSRPSRTFLKEGLIFITLSPLFMTGEKDGKLQQYNVVL